MSDVKGLEPKVEAKPADAAPAAPAPKPAEAAPAAAKVEAKPAEAKPSEAVPAVAKAEAKPAEPKPAPTAKPAEAAKPPAPAAPAAPAGPAPGTVGVRAPAPYQPSGGISVNISISPMAAAVVLSSLVVLILGLGATTLYLLNRASDRNPLAHLVDQVPGLDGAPVPVTSTPGAGAKAPPAEAAPEKITIGATFKDGFGGKPSTLPGSWPTFRGPKYDNIVTGVELANRWPKAGPPIKWTLTGLGEGYSGAAVHAGRVYLQDYDAATKEESLRCFSLEDGKEIWRRSYVMKIVNSHGFTRTIPAVSDKYVVCMGAMSHVLCTDAVTGEMKWGIDLMAEYGTQSMAKDWYTAQCPILEGSSVILAPCGKDVLMMGVDLETGKVLWKTPNPDGLQLAHSSITPMTLNGKKTYVYCAERGNMVGISAEKENLGAPLWKITCLSQKTISPSPVILEDGHIFMTAGYKAGSALVKITEAGGKYDAKVLWTLDEIEGMSCEQQTPIYFNKHLFGLMPDSSGARKQQLVCMNPWEKGKIVWESGNQKRFGQYEPILMADGKFYILDKDAALIMVKVSTQKYEELGRCKLLQGHEAWAPIALAGNLMLLRDSKVMICIDVGKGIE